MPSTSKRARHECTALEDRVKSLGSDEVSVISAFIDERLVNTIIDYSSTVQKICEDGIMTIGATETEAARDIDDGDEVLDGLAIATSRVESAITTFRMKLALKTASLTEHDEEVRKMNGSLDWMVGQIAKLEGWAENLVNSRCVD